MEVNVATEFEHSSKGIGPYLLITLTLEHSEVPLADNANKFAEWVIDKIWGKYTSIPGLIKTILTKIYGKLTPDIKSNDKGHGVIVVTHMPAGGVGVPWSVVVAREPARTGVAVGGGRQGGGDHIILRMK